MLHILLRAIEARLREASHCPDGRLGAVRFVHRFGAALNTHVHFHCGVIDGVMAMNAAGQVCCAETITRTSTEVAAVPQPVRSHVLRWFVRAGYLDASDALDMAGWEHGSGSSRSMLRCASKPPTARGWNGCCATARGRPSPLATPHARAPRLGSPAGPHR